MGSEFQRKQKLRRSKQKKYVNNKIQQRLKEKQNEETTAKQEALKDQAKKYLEQWKNKEGWKFSKATQIYLIKHAYDRKLFSKKELLPTLLEYFKSMQGSARKSK